MKALLWKDYRVNRSVLLIAAVMLVGPYLAAVAFAAASGRETLASPRWWCEALTNAAMISVALSLLSVSMLGANAFATERADRSAEFFAYLPPTRARALLSKAILALSAGCAIWLVHAVLAMVVLPRLDAMSSGISLPDGTIKFLLPTAVLVFGTAWAASTVLSSPAAAAGLSFAAPLIVGGALLTLSHFTGAPRSEDLEAWYRAACVTLGVFAFILFSVVYTRRVTP
jgi:ABC-type transport system involved in multi-copper enzyme maturation permease subunit